MGHDLGVEEAVMSVSRADLRDRMRIARAEAYGANTWRRIPRARAGVTVLVVVSLFLLARAGEAGVQAVAGMDPPALSMPHLSAPDVPDVPWLTVAWTVGVLVMVGLAVWAWRRQSYGLPWRYRLRRVWRRY